MPRPDFPHSLPEFVQRFSTPEACFLYIIDSRWPDGFVCERCRHEGAWAHVNTLTMRCKQCRKVYSATAGTVMHRSRQPLCNWLWAAYLMATDKRGLSAVYLREQLNINRYETAFNMLHKLRAAMVNPDRTPLHGTVEVDEFYVGGIEAGRPGRGAEDKAVVVAAVEVREGRPGRARFRVIPRIAREPLYRFIKETIELGSAVVTDGNLAYDTLTVTGYPHKIVSTAYGDDPDAVLPHLHTAVSNLKTWLMGTHHGAVSKKHLQAYLNEFAFRYNRRGNLQAAFQTILGLSSKVEGPTYEGLYRGTFEHKNPRLTATHKG